MPKICEFQDEIGVRCDRFACYGNERREMCSLHMNGDMSYIGKNEIITTDTLCRSNTTFNVVCKNQGNGTYNMFCPICFGLRFPTNPKGMNVRKKNKALIIIDFVINNFPSFSCEPIYKKLNRFDLSYKLENKTFLIFITNDQKQIENKDKNTIIICYNIGKFLDKNGVSRNPSIGKRLPILKKFIEKVINNPIENINYLYFNENK